MHDRDVRWSKVPTHTHTHTHTHIYIYAYIYIYPFGAGGAGPPGEQKREFIRMCKHRLYMRINVCIKDVNLGLLLLS